VTNLWSANSDRQQWRRRTDLSWRRRRDTSGTAAFRETSFK